MYLNLTVPMPVGTGKLSVKRIKNTPYIYYETGRTYDAEKKYNKPKAIVQTYLAGQPVLVNTLANAAKKGLWDFTNPVFNNIVDFIKNLI